MLHQSERLISAAWFGLLGYVAGLGIQCLFILPGIRNSFLNDLTISLLPFVIPIIISIGYSIAFEHTKFKIAGLPFLATIIFLGIVCSSIQVCYVSSLQKFPYFMGPGTPSLDKVGFILFLLKQGSITLLIAAVLGYFFGYKILFPHTSFLKSLSLGFNGGTLAYLLYIFIYFPLIQFIIDPPALSANDTQNPGIILATFIVLGYFFIGWAVSLIGVISAIGLHRIKKILIS